jgi:hypothetical protein
VFSRNHFTKHRKGPVALRRNNSLLRRRERSARLILVRLSGQNTGCVGRAFDA